ncbi:MAG: hypothetical protein D6812_03965 [Deltaproteobacteria bacterium]|nr:MAG: hypothetical protein D6812_03965 [Deltaproteobacteria bacterium]
MRRKGSTIPSPHPLTETTPASRGRRRTPKGSPPILPETPTERKGYAMKRTITLLATIFALTLLQAQGPCAPEPTCDTGDQVEETLNIVEAKTAVNGFDCFETSFALPNVVLEPVELDIYYCEVVRDGAYWELNGSSKCSGDFPISEATCDTEEGRVRVQISPSSCLIAGGQNTIQFCSRSVDDFFITDAHLHYTTCQ